MRCGGVAKAEITMANREETAGFQTAPEIGDRAREIFKAQEVIAPHNARLTQAAVPKHRHAEDGIIGRRGLCRGRFCGCERNGRPAG